MYFLNRRAIASRANNLRPTLRRSLDTTKGSPGAQSVQFTSKSQKGKTHFSGLGRHWLEDISAPTIFLSRAGKACSDVLRKTHQPGLFFMQARNAAS